MQPIFLASDLDRTVIPNGKQEESTQARPLFKKLVDSSQVILSYVSGRNKQLIQKAIQEYDIPIPDYAIGDVGTTIYIVGSQQVWEPLQVWADTIGKDWGGRSWEQIKELFDDIADIRLQDDNPAFQNTHKVSYYTDADIDHHELQSRLQTRGEEVGINASFIWSVDEERNVGLLDILPASATKLHAVEFLYSHIGFAQDRVVCAGDSGNDLPILTSGLQAVLVKNARDQVKEEAIKGVAGTNKESSLYLAQGDFLGMNGNYSAGVVEGVVHFFPAAKQLIE